MSRIGHGCSRSGIRVGRWFVKVPTVRYGWGRFLFGLLDNMREAGWWRALRHPRMCPVVFSLPGGWLNVMPFCGPVEQLDREAAIEDESSWWTDDIGWIIEMSRANNMGRFEGRVVTFDYACLNSPIVSAEGLDLEGR